MLNIFFLDIFNKILKINEKEVMIVFDKENEIWFGFVDILKVLDYNNLGVSPDIISINNFLNLLFIVLCPTWCEAPSIRLDI